MHKAICILLSVSSDYFLLYFDICLNMQRFVYSEFCKYRQGLRRNKDVFMLTYYAVILYTTLSKLSPYSKIFTSGPLLKGFLQI